MENHQQPKHGGGQTARNLVKALKSLGLGERAVKTADDVLNAEQHILELRRKKVHTPVDRRYFGVALSGGGIRSATLSLGVLQGLARRGLLPYMDYLSTVSCGGYMLHTFLETQSSAVTSK